MVSARRGPPNDEDSSKLQLTGRPVSAIIISRASRSCSGLRVAKWLATAKLVTRPFTASIARINPALSNPACGRPSGLCPPVMAKLGSLPSASAKPARVRIWSSNPIKIRQAAPPTLSTTAFVASVVERLTRLILAFLPPQLLSVAAIAAPTPTDRSWRVVRDLE